MSYKSLLKIDYEPLDHNEINKLILAADKELSELEKDPTIEELPNRDYLLFYFFRLLWSVCKRNQVYSYMQTEELMADAILIFNSTIPRYAKNIRENKTKSSGYPAYLKASVGLQMKSNDIFDQHISFSRNARELRRTLSICSSKLEKELRRKPTKKELSDSSGISLKRIDNIHKHYSNNFSIHIPLDDIGDPESVVFESKDLGVYDQFIRNFEEFDWQDYLEKIVDRILDDQEPVSYTHLTLPTICSV